MLIVDAHLDLSLNALSWNRDLRKTVSEVRHSEAGLTDLAGRGNGTVTLPEMRRAGIGVCLATQIGHCVSDNRLVPGWNSPELAWAQTQGQLAWYRAMEDVGEMRQLTRRRDLVRQVEALERNDCAGPLGYVLSLEGADSLVTLTHLERAYAYGLRALGPAHYGPGRYAPGTGETGPLEPKGRELTRLMDELGMAMDVTHLTDEGFFEAMDLFDGPVWASHSNCRSIVPGQRQLSDEQIRMLVDRDAVIGAVFDAWMLFPDWERGETTPQSSGLKLAAIVEHVDHICQIAGSSRHCGIGSDLDGGFGSEQTPQDLNTISDLRKLVSLFEERGYDSEDIEGIMHGNWIRVLSRALPE